MCWDHIYVILSQYYEYSMYYSTINGASSGVCRTPYPNTICKSVPHMTDNPYMTYWYHPTSLLLCQVFPCNIACSVKYPPANSLTCQSSWQSWCECGRAGQSAWRYVSGACDQDLLWENASKRSIWPSRRRWNWWELWVLAKKKSTGGYLRVNSIHNILIYMLILYNQKYCGATCCIYMYVVPI